MHVRPAVLHLHFLAQVGSALQAHLIIYLQPTAAVGRVVHTGHHPVSSLVHPKPSGLGAAVIGYRQFFSRYWLGISIGLCVEAVLFRSEEASPSS